MIDKREEQLAQELDAFLTARQQGRPLPPVSVELAAECRLADELLNVAAQTTMSPSFLSDLEAQLMAAAVGSAASRSQPATLAARPKAAASKRPSAWQEFIKQIEDVFTMRKITYAFGAIMALIMIGTAVWFARPGSDGPTVVADLPPLPGIGGGAREMGAGGGGGGFGGGTGVGEDAILVEPGMEGGVDIGMPIWDPFAEAEFELATDLPRESGQQPVYTQVAGGFFGLDEANHFASLFGFTGGAYIEKYPDFFDPDWTPPASYQFFDGRRQLSITDAHFYYMDNSLSIERESDYLPFNQAAPIVESFLRERGLLNFPYEMAAPLYSQYAVEIRRVVDGVAIIQPEYQVHVAAVNGQIISLFHTPYNGLTLLGNYPIRSAAEAWQTFVDEGVDYRRINFNIMPGPDYVMPEYPEPDADFIERYRYWERTYQDGDTVQTQPYVMVYLPAFDGGLPRIQIDRYQLIADADSLWAISEQAGKTIFVKGIYRQLEHGPALELVEWRPQEEAGYFFTQGRVQRIGADTFLASDEGETFLIPDAPAELQDRERIYISGLIMDETVDGRRVVEWTGIGRSPEEEMMPEEAWMPFEPAEEHIIRLVNITQAELVYMISYVYENHTVPPTLIVQPAWRFSGTTNTNEVVEIYVQAVADQLIEQE